MNDRIHPFVVGGQGTAKEALDGLAQDWDSDAGKKYGRADGRGTGGTPRSSPAAEHDTR